LIKDFEDKIDSFFAYIKSDRIGMRLVAKIGDDGRSFTQDEIYTDFERLYRKYTIINKSLGDFFKRETKDILNQLCDDFEKSLSKPTVKLYPINEVKPSIPAEPDENNNEMETAIIISLVRGAMQAISLWQSQKDRSKAKAALVKAKTDVPNSGTIEEGIKLLSIIPMSTLTLMTQRVEKCFSKYETVLDDKAFLPTEIDDATDALVKCICRELTRIHKLNGAMPTTTLKKYWDQYGCKG
jgi:hypothetical protein